MNFCPGIPCFIIGNKIDLINKRVISYREAENFAKKLSQEYYETSAKTGRNIFEVFHKIAEKILKIKGGID